MGNLLVASPALAAEWHPTKNDNLLPQDVSVAAHKIVWWKCPLGHEFQKSINSRYNSGRGITKCPICANRQVLPGFNDLETLVPEVAREWHPVLNAGMKPSEITPKSSQQIWWLCANGHEWRAKPNARIGSGNGCPVCSNHKILPGTNDLATVNPPLASEWHPELNAELTADQVAPSSGTSVWWLCLEGHEYNAKISDRNAGERGTGCPYCAHRKLLPGFNDLATVAPEIAAQWHPVKNGTLKAFEVFSTTHKQYWWQCDTHPEHCWKQSPAARVSHKTGCGICSGKQVQTGINDFATRSPELLKEWDSSKNSISPTDITEGSQVKVWWTCKLGHEWQQTPQNRKRLGCPYCANKKVLVGFNDLATTLPEIAHLWHPTLNGELKPTQVTTGSNKKVWWVCPNTGNHPFSASVVELKSGRGCAVCAGQQVLAGVNDLGTNNPLLETEWDYERNAPHLPSGLTVSSHLKVWWNCPKGHSYQAVIASRSSGTGCPICNNKVLLVGYNDMATTNPELAIEWHPSKNEGRTPSDIVAGSLTSVWWQCSEGHEWKAMAAHRLSGGTGCPSCATFGYDPSKPGILYFIENERLNARKVGITNVGKSRLKKFSNFGWETVNLLESPDGQYIARIEKALLQEIRVNFQLPQLLGKEEMRTTGGWTETFSIDGASNAQIVSKIEQLAAELKELGK